MRFEGVIRCWNDERGFGFIEPTLGGQAVFVHVKAFARGVAPPTPGQRVSFEVELGPQGKKRACKVQPVRPARQRARGPQNSAVRYGGATLFAIPAFLVVYVAVGVLWRPPAWLAWGYLAASVATFAAYAIDKSSARSGGWRIAERTLHVLSLAGGWPGALVAQQFLRHKSAKVEFRVVFWGTVVANVTAFIVLCSPIGRQWAVS